MSASSKIKNMHEISISIIFYYSIATNHPAFCLNIRKTQFIPLSRISIYLKFPHFGLRPRPTCATYRHCTPRRNITQAHCDALRVFVIFPKGRSQVHRPIRRPAAAAPAAGLLAFAAIASVLNEYIFLCNCTFQAKLFRKINNHGK